MQILLNTIFLTAVDSIPLTEKPSLRTNSVDLEDEVETATDEFKNYTSVWDIWQRIYMAVHGSAFQVFQSNVIGKLQGDLAPWWK